MQFIPFESVVMIDHLTEKDKLKLFPKVKFSHKEDTKDINSIPIYSYDKNGKVYITDESMFAKISKDIGSSKSKRKDLKRKNLSNENLTQKRGKVSNGGMRRSRAQNWIPYNQRGRLNPRRTHVPTIARVEDRYGDFKSSKIERTKYTNNVSLH